MPERYSGMSVIKVRGFVNIQINSNISFAPLLILFKPGISAQLQIKMGHANAISILLLYL